MKGWRTIVGFALTGVLYLLGWDQITQVIPAQYLAVATTVVGVALRFVTNTPVGSKT